MAVDEDEVTRLEERLHAARHDLRATYERRDALATDIDGVRRTGRHAGRDLEAAQIALKDAAYALSELTGADPAAQLGQDP